MIKTTNKGFYKVTGEGENSIDKYVNVASVQLAYVVEVASAKKGTKNWMLVIMSGGVKYDLARYKTPESANKDLKMIVGE